MAYRYLLLYILLTLTVLVCGYETAASQSEITVTNMQFQPTLTCYTRDSAIFITNNGTDTATLTRLIVNDPANSYTVIPPKFPVQLLPGSSIRIAVTFRPNDTGIVQATITCVIANSTGTTETDRIVSTLSGNGRIVEARAHIAKHHKGLAGEFISVPILLDDNIDSLQVSQLTIRISIDQLLFLNTSFTERTSTQFDGSLLEGWTFNVVELNDKVYEATFTAPIGKFLRGTGLLLTLQYIYPRDKDYAGEYPADLFEHDTVETDIHLTITSPDRPCVKFVSSDGHLFIERTQILELYPIWPNPAVNNAASRLCCMNREQDGAEHC